MLVRHYRKDFIEVMVGKRVVIIAHQDVDAACTVKVITQLFKTEGIAFIMLSCGGITELKAKYDEYASQSDVFIMVNCGGTIDLLDTLENPSLDKVFFIMDHHRPIHIINYYNTTNQIRIVSVPEPDEVIPAFDQIFAEDPEISDDSDDEEQMDDEDDEIDEYGMTGRMRRRAGRKEQRKIHETWLEKRERALFEYREHFYYARPTALYALEITWVMSRDDMESIWCTIVALTDALVTGRLTRAQYTDFASTVNNHILRITNAEKLPRDCLKLRFERELYMFLYRSWSVYDSAKATPYLVSTLKTWSLDGNRRFHQLLAYLGLPLVEVRQKYTGMSLELRRQLVEMFSSEVVVEKYKLPDVVFGSFVAEIGFRPKFNALDVQLATLAVLNDPGSIKTSEEKFIDAIQQLDVRNLDAHKEGVEKAKSMLKLLQSQIQMMVDMKLVQEVGPFLYVQLSECLADFNYFKRPTTIPILAHFLQHAGIRSGKRKWKQSPWIIMIPYSEEYFIAVGVQAGAYEQAEKNIFSEVFRIVKGRLEPGDVISDYFANWVVLVKTAKRQAFSDTLISISD